MTPQHNLAAEPNEFIGRERDLVDLRQLLDTARVVTLCGSGGIGKTRLAMRVAADMAVDFDDGVRLVELADVRAGSGQDDVVARRVAAAFGLAEEPGRRAADTLTDALADRRALIVLDNCEHLIEECAQLSRALLACCARLRVLATSREPLHIPGETVWRVPPLTATGENAEAVRLFAVRAAAGRPGFTLTEQNTATVAGLCRDLDGMPLALELAAARVRVLAVEQIAERLRDRFRLLGTSERAAPPRHRTLRATIDWSHDLLTEQEQVLLRRLSVFAGWTLGQAEQVCAGDLLDADTVLDEGDVLDLLTALVDKSLVVVDREVEGETRFRLLDSIRQYAAERLAEAGEDTDLRRRHRDGVLEAAELHGEIAMCERTATWPERISLYRRYDVEQDNVRAAITWSLAQRDAEEGLRVCTSLRSYWMTRGYFAEWAGWFDRFLALGGGVPPRIRGAALVGRAQLAFDQGDLTMAGAAAEDGLRLCREAGDDVMTAAALNTLAGHAMGGGRLDEAAARLAEGLTLVRSTGDRWNEGLLLATEGVYTARQGRFREAQQRIEASLGIFRDLQQLWGVARTLTGLGMIAQARGDQQTARRHYEEALPILRDIEARPEIARCLSGIGRTATDQGDLDTARDALTESLSLNRSAGMRLGVARGLEAFAALAAREDDPRRVVRLVGAAAALRDAVGRPPSQAARIEQLLGPARKRFGEQAVAQLWSDGRQMPVEEAIRLAFSPVAERSEQPVRHAAAPAAPPSTLTPREHEIAKLIARGLSNRGIADELVISPATVARHVTNILTKLGFTSRAQIAAWEVDNAAGPNMRT